jgi:predicted HicB family RNase H-like nuclease
MAETYQQVTTTLPNGAPPPQVHLPIAEKRQLACRAAEDVFRQSTDWVSFFREVLGVDGIVRKMFPNATDMLAFEQSAEYAEIQQMVVKLREQSKFQIETSEPTKVITVRLPKSLHESLREEAHQKQTSMNQLCISKLLRIICNDGVSSDDSNGR